MCIRDSFMPKFEGAAEAKAPKSPEELRRKWEMVMQAFSKKKESK